MTKVFKNGFDSEMNFTAHYNPQVTSEKPFDLQRMALLYKVGATLQDGHCNAVFSAAQATKGWEGTTIHCNFLE